MLHYKTLSNNNVKITADSGKIVDVRNSNIYSEVICKDTQTGYFEEVTE